MSRRNIPMLEAKEILYQWTKGMSVRRIGTSLKVSRNTIRKIIKQAQEAGFERTGEKSNFEDLPFVMFNTKIKEKKSVQDELASYHAQIDAWKQCPYMTVVQMMRLFEESYQKKVSETSLRRYIKKHFPTLPCSTVHLETLAGQQAQVDFGFVGLMKDPVTQQLKKAYAFIMTLSYSRHRFVHFVFKQDITMWTESHIKAFHFFGGVPESILLDNLKAGILKVDLYDPTLNPTYGELERHYGFIADPAKVRTPQHKGKVERSVTIVRQQVLAGRTFKDIEEANAFAHDWCRNQIAHRVVRTTGQTPWERFEIEREKLKPLPLEDYQLSIWRKAKVQRDHHVVFEGSFYSLPTAYIGQTVWIKASARLVELFLEEKRIKSHTRVFQKGKWVTDPTDYPKSARAFLENDGEKCLEKAQKIGLSTHSFISQFLDKPSLTHQRKAQAVLRLGEEYGEERLEAACHRALSFENEKYSCLKRILQNSLDQKEEKEEKSILPKESCYLRNASPIKGGSH